MTSVTNPHPTQPGTLALIVGPSGAGKDTLMNAARAAFSGDARFVFARRLITRPADGATEDHEAITDEGFAEALAAGRICLHWQAHGLRYGLPATILADLATGKTVIANISRGAIRDAEALWPRAIVLNVTAPPEILAARLARRGRESAADIAARLSREAPIQTSGAPVHDVINAGAVEDAAREFLNHLRQART
jgi:phosphonate metabolism protein PhnN/1,5-bisphosphokinase (PRPP-forming)